MHGPFITILRDYPIEPILLLLLLCENGLNLVGFTILPQQFRVQVNRIVVQWESAVGLIFELSVWEFLSAIRQGGDGAFHAGRTETDLSRFGIEHSFHDGFSSYEASAVQTKDRKEPCSTAAGSRAL
jgi:hypothetical protein